MPKYLCPHCKQSIDDDEALLCLYCGESLRRPVGFMGKLKYSGGKVIALVLIALTLFFLLRALLR